MTRILLADDCPDTVDSLTVLLRLWGHEVRSAGDGPTILEEASRRRPDIVVMDLALSRLDGYEVARRLRKLPGLERVLLAALTGYSDECHRRRADQAGFDFYMVKPIDPGILYLLLESATARGWPRPRYPSRANHDSEHGHDEPKPSVCVYRDAPRGLACLSWSTVH